LSTEYPNEDTQANAQENKEFQKVFDGLVQGEIACFELRAQI